MTEPRRSLPHSLDAERALLGGLITDPSQIDAIGEVVGPGAFYRPDHGALFRLLQTMQSACEPIDGVTLPMRILQDPRPDDYGGTTYVMQLPDHAPSTANLRHYAEIITEKATLRRAIGAADTLQRAAMAEAQDSGPMISAAIEVLGGLSVTRAGTWTGGADAAAAAIERIDQRASNPSDTTGCTTGFAALDRMLAGFHPTDLVILAARPAMGKTALALNFAQNVAMLCGRTVGIFSLEMSSGQLTERILSCLSTVDGGAIKTGRLQPDEWERLAEAQSAPVWSRLHIDDTASLALADIRGRATRLKAEHPDLAVIVVDYIQLIGGGNDRDNRQQQISDISRGLKVLAKDLDVTVIALSQLSRKPEERTDKRPMPSDLRDSGAIEQDADVILFIYRDEVYNPDSPDKGLAEIIIAKQRNGPTGTVKLAFNGAYARFDDVGGLP